MTTTPIAAAQSSPHQAAEIFYPETDGMPLPDGFEQEPHFIEVVSSIRFHVEGPTTAVSGNTFIYYAEGYPQRSVSPDCYVAFDINKDSLHLYDSYRVWEVGKMPDFVLEIGSSSTAANDVGPKRTLYASLGAREYWRFDPTGGDYYGEPLVGEYLENGEYRRFELTSDADCPARGRSPLLGLDLCWREGRLRFYDPAAGRWLENYDETASARLAAEAELSSERAARLAAEAELERLRQRLK